MSTPFTERIQELKAQNRELKSRQKELAEQIDHFNANNLSLETMVESSRLLTTLANHNTERVVHLLEQIINQALLAMYPDGSYTFKMKNSFTTTNMQSEAILYEKVNGELYELNLSEQAGDGISRMISFLFSLSLIELSGKRKFVALDEVLSGLHTHTLQVVQEILRIFMNGGFQFIVCEYDINDMGMLYLGEKTSDGIIFKSLGDAETANYVRETI